MNPYEIRKILGKPVAVIASSGRIMFESGYENGSDFDSSLVSSERIVFGADTKTVRSLTLVVIDHVLTASVNTFIVLNIRLIYHMLLSIIYHRTVT